MLEKIIEGGNVGKVLLIDPAFPTAHKSRNHKDLLPVGLLKISSYLKNRGIKTKLIRLNNNECFDEEIRKFSPDLIMVTSVFTYWFEEVKKAIKYSERFVSRDKIILGGILASLCYDECKREFPGIYIHKGLISGAEHIKPDYSILENGGKDIDFQIIHSTRGCKRKCPFCGVRKIEDIGHINSIEKELIGKKTLVFYDNNLLDNPNIEELLHELIKLRKERKITKCESQSGFDGRLLHENENLARLLKEANFKDPKIAWDGPYKSYKRREEEISILERAGYNRKEIAVFMLYNHDLSYEELEKKRALCFKWGVQVSDCRFRPLDRLKDGYNPNKRKQEDGEYYIHKGWSDEKIRQFRRNVRRHNICIRHDMLYHSKLAERKKISKEESMYIRDGTAKWAMATGIIDDAWDPSKPFEIKK